MAEDADDPAHPALLPDGTNIVWTYLVRGQSTTSLTITSIVDDNGTPSNLADDFHPVYVSGDTNNNHLLDSNEVWLYTSQNVKLYPATTAQIGNMGTVTATAAGKTVTASDMAYVQGYVPTVHIQKAVNAVDPLHPTVAEDANDPNNPALIVTGANVVWTYLVTDLGSTPLSLFSVVDDNGTPTDGTDDFHPAYVSGDTNNNGLLDLTEAWLYTSQGVKPYQATTGLHGNIGTVTVTAGGQTITASDPAYLKGYMPGVTIQKVVNALDPLHPTAAEDANDPAHPALLLAGTDVVWTYLVSNTTSTALTVTSVVDDGGGNPADAFTAAAVVQTGTSFNIGDTNLNGLLDPTEVWEYTSKNIVSYQATTAVYENVGTVTATIDSQPGSLPYTASDSAYLQGYVPEVAIQKVVNAADPLHPTAAEDANDPNNPALLPVGAKVVWTYLVTNTGLAPLAVASVVDDGGGNPANAFTAAAVVQAGASYNIGDTNVNGLLDLTEVWEYTSQNVVTYQATTAPYVNVGTVTAKAGGLTVTASDKAYLKGYVPTVRIQKAVNAADPLHPTAAEDANDPNNPAMIVAGNNVVWTYLVTDLLATPLNKVSVVDDNGTLTTADDFNPVYISGDTNNDHKLDPTEVWLYSSATVKNYQAVDSEFHGNIATVTVTNANGQTVTANDPAYLLGTIPQIFVQKAINALDPMRPTAAELAQSAPGLMLPVGTPVVWTYQVYDEGDALVQVTSVRDDNGTPSNLADDFTAVAILQTDTSFNVGDSNRNGLLDPGEEFLFTSAGVSSGATTNWSQVFQNVLTYTDTSGSGMTPGFVVDPVQTANSFSDNIFTNGGSKDVNGISQWQWKLQMPQDKDDLENAFGAVLADPGTGHTLLFTGADRYAANGNSTVGFWFFQNPISVNANGTFSGVHTDGDLLLTVNFAVSSSNPPITAYRWTGTDATGTLTQISTPTGSTFAVVPAGPITVPWSFVDKSGNKSPQTGELLEVGADLNLLFGGNAPHYVSFLTETRSSNSTNSTLSDFALGSVNTIGTGYKVTTGQYSNTATVTGVDQGTHMTVVAKDTNYHFGVAAQIQVQKAVNAADPLHPTITEDANTASGIFLPAGASVTWTYLVTNTGNVALTAPSLADDAGTTPLMISGDTIKNGLLDPGETWLYQATGKALSGQNTSSVTVTASDLLLNQTVTAKDAANYFGSSPGVKIVEAINATDPNHPTGIEDANAAPGKAFVKGTSVVWTYQVFNTGNVALSLTSLKDNNGTISVTTDDFSPAPVLSSGYNVGDINHNNLLDTTEAWLYTSQGVKSSTVGSGQYSNIGTVTVRDPNTNQTVTATDVNYHWGQANGEGLTPTFWKTNADTNGAVAWPRFNGRTGPLVYSPTQLLSSVFTLPSSLGLSTVTFNGALGLSGTTGANALMRSAVAALLNAAHPLVAYPLTARQVIDQVNAALAGNTNGMNKLQTTLNGYNNLGSDLDQSGNASGPQLAAALPTGTQTGVSLLTQAQLTPIVEEALSRWATVTGLPALKPEDVHVTIADLPDGSNGQLPVLGYTTAGTVLIDINAGGFGWFVDPTPSQNEEFSLQLAQGGLAATSSSEAYGKMDLLTVVSHEIGHLLGFEDGNGLKLMDTTLAAGVRELPASSAIDSTQAFGAGGLPTASTEVSFFDTNSGSFLKADQPLVPVAKKERDHFLVVMDSPDSNQPRNELYELTSADNQRGTPVAPVILSNESDNLLSVLRRMAARINGKK